VLSRINEAVIRIHDRTELMQEVCKIAVGEGNFIRAWIGCGNESTRQINAIVASGTIDGFFVDVHKSTDPLPDEKSLTGTALWEGRSTICNDIDANPDLVHWTEDAKLHGYHSAASFPLTTGTTVRCALTLFSQELNFFTDSEIQLLTELTEDISFSFETMELEENKIKIREDLEHSEHRLAAIINFFPEPLFAIDKSGIVIIWNKAMEIFSNISAEDVLGKGDYRYSSLLTGEQKPILIDLVLATEDEIVKSDYSGIVRNGHILRAEKTITLVNGEKKILHVTASPLYDEKGQYIGAIESVLDITDTRQTEDLHTAITNSGDAGVLMVDHNFVMLFINRKMAEMLGDVPEKITGRKFQEFLFEEDIRIFEDLFSQPCSGKADCQYGNFRQRLRKVSGKPVFFQVAATGLARQNEPFSGFFGLFRNST
jgi:PAS domain S-box-containing protein